MEYALLAGLIGLAALIALDKLKATMKSVYEARNQRVNDLWVPPDPPAAPK